MMFDRMRIAVHPGKLVTFSETRISFYKKYSYFVLKTLRKPLFQSFLLWIMKRESIEEYAITSVKVMTFPFKKKNGNGLAGKCNSKGEINIYPKKLKFCRKLKQKFGKEMLYSYIKNRARATLIHELLHMKYCDNEEKVRKLTKNYLNFFTRDQNTRNPNKNDVLRILFKH